MIAAALKRQAKGLDVVFAGKFDRADASSGTAPGLFGNEVKGAPFDPDAILARRPGLVVIDRIAQENPPGSRHPQRWQDVEDLLEHGLQVFTTLDIADIASLSDATVQLKMQSHSGKIPDRLLDEAEIILVDLPPSELLRQSSKRVDGDELSRLAALREMALNLTARHVDRQMQEYMRTGSIIGPLPARPRLMVCISTHPISERLVRTGRRLAHDSNADWVVVYVETPDRLRFSPRHNERLSRTLRLAEELGAQVVGISGRTVPEAVIDYAINNNITQIIVGKPLRPRLVEILSGSLVDEIIRMSGPIDVYVISDSTGPLDKGFPVGLRPHAPWTRYGLAALIVLVVSILCIPIHFYIESTNLVMLYLLAVILSAFYLGRGPSILASLLSVVAFDYFFIEPRLSLTVNDTQYILTFLGLFGTGLAISHLTGLVRSQVEAAQNREARAAMLYNLSRELTTSRDLNSVLDTVLQHLSKIFDREAVILLPGQNELDVRATSQGLKLDEKEKEAAEWAFHHARPSGRGTDTLPETAIRWQPLRTAQGVVGTLGVRPSAPRQALTMEQRQLLEAYSSLAALAIERASLEEQASQSRLLQETEKLQTALLNSISHDLRTPLASVTGALSSLHEAEVGDEVVMDHETRLELIDTGWQEAERLNRLVGNLLDMTRLESGAIRLNFEDGDIEDVIGTALARLHNRLTGYRIHTRISTGRPLVKMDSGLIEQVLVNLLDNAAKYSPPGSEIEVGANQCGGELEVWVADHGRGVPPEDLEHIFEKFFRVQRTDGISGTGLGLSICKGIIEAHGGSIRAQNGEDGGTIITFSLPIAATDMVTQGG